MKVRAITIISVLILTLAYACESESSIEFKQYYASGAAVYQQHCQNCHGGKGEGLAALIPPLTDTASIKKIKEQLPCILQNGLKGQINVSGRSFNGQMPAASLTPIEIAQVITYVGNSFGNKAGLTTNDNVTTNLAKCN
jgi:mono/diheme cytochrome c family protein